MVFNYLLTWSGFRSFPGSAVRKDIFCPWVSFAVQERKKSLGCVHTGWKKKERKKCHPRLAWLYVDRGGKASLLIKSSLSQSVKAAQITKTVIQLKLMLKKKNWTGWLHPLHVFMVCLPHLKKENQHWTPPLSASLSPKSPPRRYPLISVDTLLDS